MTITIHKGSHRIGGSITEISTSAARIIIDMGSDLPSQSEPMVNFEVEGVTIGKETCDAILLTHYHGDHIGLVKQVLPNIPIYIGKTAKEILLHLVNRTDKEQVPKIATFRTFEALNKIKIKDITITPFFIDHSAFDAYMFLIEAEGIRILHTGDFRTHGFRGQRLFKMLKSYVGQVDYLICEGTMLSRMNEKIKTEQQLQTEAKALMENHKYVFVLCSSTNIDRIGAFYHANPKGRLFVCDKYQKDILDTVRKEHGNKSDFYDFEYTYSYTSNLDSKMSEKGFCMLIRSGFDKTILDKYKDKALIIYSMWTGYLDDRAKNQKLIDFLNPYHYVVLHTSGHASTNAIKQICDVVKPNKGIIPIHTEKPENFVQLCKEYQVLLLNDREEFVL